MTLLLLSVYVLTVTVVYHRAKTLFPVWQLRAELAAMFGGLAVWVGLGAYVGRVL